MTWRADWQSKLDAWASKDRFVLELLGKQDNRLMEKFCREVQWFEDGEVPSCYPGD
jgi:hypothetical protein